MGALIGGTVKTADAELADCGGNYVAIQMWPMFVLEPAAYVDEQITFIPIQAKKKVFTEKLGSRVKTLCFWMRRRISIRGCVHPSVRPSVRPSVCPVLFSKMKSTHTRRILCRVSGLVFLIVADM